MAIKKITKILVVDDEAIVRDFLGRLLTLEDLDVTLVDSGSQAIEAMKKDQFGLVFLDVRMPGMDGVETFRELKKISPHSKYVMMTGYSLDELLKKMEGEEVEAIVTKPFDINEIVTILEDYQRQRYPEDIISILIVETEDAVSNFFKKLLKTYDVVTVKKGNDALEQLKIRHYDLVISDLMLEDMNGVELYSRIKSIRPSAEIILVTGDAKKTEGLIKSCLYQQIKNLIK
jgi:two-component system, NtrC family, response regulator HydG